MTTEIAFYQKKNHAPAAGGHDGQVLLNLLRRRAGRKNGDTGTVAAALLKRAHGMLVNAEGTLARQDKRMSALEDMMMIDEITDLYNRRGFSDALVRELGRCERNLSAGGLLVFIEIDNFAVITGDHGTMAGEACLRLVARALKADIRAMDVAARLDDDEFILLLPDTTKKEAAGRVQTLGWRLNNLSLAWYGDIVPVHAGLRLRAYGKEDRAEEVFGDAVSPRHRKSGCMATQEEGSSQHS